MPKYVNPKMIQYALGKIRKSSNFNYQQAIRRNKKGLVRTSPLAKLLEHLNSRNYTDKEIDGIVAEYWNRLEKNPKMEKEIAEKIKMLYKGKS
tara:strand:+ start:1141 stop:1419 length:279 start_codon:yes stop_codon:yes gene_type:complete